MAVHAVDDGYSDVLCGNGNICGRNTTGPGICCKFDFRVFNRYVIVVDVVVSWP